MSIKKIYKISSEQFLGKNQIQSIILRIMSKTYLGGPMKINFLISLVVGTTSVLTSIKNQNEEFKYKYQVVANSFSPQDETALYYFKEELINKYEKYVMDLDEESKKIFLKENINIFSQNNKNLSSYYVDGTIKLVIGKGKGSVIKGNLKMNVCEICI